MPSPFLTRLENLSSLHNALANAHLESRAGIPTSALLEEIGCGTKAFYNQLQDLRDLGAPLDYLKESHLWRYTCTWNFPVSFLQTIDGPAGIRLELNYLLDPVLEKEIAGLVAVDPALRRTGNSTLPRLTGRFPHHLLGRLARALRDRRRVRFSYRKPSESQSSHREVEPLELFEWNGMPYLQARDPHDTAQPHKRYALSRMDHLEVLETTFKPAPKKQIPSCLGAYCGKMFTATIAADAESAPFVRERQWHPSQKNRERAHGAIEFTLPFGNVPEAARWILGQGPGFRPVAPNKLVEEWTKLIKELHKLSEGRKN